MSRVSYFQRFSQAENHATNNTLLVLRYFYQSSPFKIQRVLTELVEKDLSIGLSFQQQIRGELSVPDALITQEPLHIYVETKRGGQLDADQLRRHLQTIAKSETRGGEILIGLTKEQIAEADRNALTANAAAEGVAFAAVTFSQVAEALRQQCAPHESELLAIVEDYETYLADEKLTEEREKWLVVFPRSNWSFLYSVKRRASVRKSYWRDPRLILGCSKWGAEPRLQKIFISRALNVAIN